MTDIYTEMHTYTDTDGHIHVQKGTYMGNQDDIQMQTDGIHMQTDRQTYRLADRQTDTYTDRQTNNKSARQTERQTDRKKTDRHTDRHACNQTGRHTSMLTCIHADRNAWWWC